jgi:hypothetical protein
VSQNRYRTLSDISCAVPERCVAVGAESYSGGSDGNLVALRETG